MTIDEPLATQLSLGLPAVGRPWPDHARFPRNTDGEEIGRQLSQDLIESRNPLIITGYASPERLLELKSSGRSSSTPEVSVPGCPDRIGQ